MPKQSLTKLTERRRKAQLEWVASLPVGHLSGECITRWNGKDRWDYVPYVPLTFVRGNGEVIVLNRTFPTDYGTLFLLLQIVSNISRTAYGPAFVIHDDIWHFRGTPFCKYNFEESNIILAECMKTMMEMKLVETRYLDIVTVYAGVQSLPARLKWNRGIK